MSPNRIHPLRLNTLYLVPALAVGLLGFKLVRLQVTKYGYYTEQAEAQHHQTSRMSPLRGKVLDSDGQELASSEMVTAAYVNPGQVIPKSTTQTQARLRERFLDEDSQRKLPKQKIAELEAAIAEDPKDRAAAMADEISTRFKADQELVAKALTAPGGPRRLPLELDAAGQRDLAAIFKRREPCIPSGALWFVDVNRRLYPHGDLASQLIGYTVDDDTGDNRGMGGIEYCYNDMLRGRLGEFSARTNAMQNPMEPAPDELIESTFGKSLTLTIDSTIQQAAEKAVAEAQMRHAAASAVAVVVKVRTGEVLAMASVPSSNIADLRWVSEPVKRNRAVSDQIEPGSVMKIFTFSSLFEEGLATPETVIDCAGGKFSLNGRVISDSHLGLGAIPIRKVFEQSSNVGSVRAAQPLGKERFRRRLAAFGFGEPTGIDLPGEASGKLKPVGSWSAQSMGSVPMGYELQMTAIQVATACAALGNHGWLMKPHVVKEIRDARGNVTKTVEPEAVRRVVGDATCLKMRDMMEQVVDTGTGKSARVPGYRVGGKTGTTKKFDPKTHQYTANKYIGSFCGLAPIDDPQVCIYVYLDNPGGAVYYGGTVAAPMFADIAAVCMKRLNVPPSSAKPDTGTVSKPSRTSFDVSDGGAGEGDQPEGLDVTARSGTLAERVTAALTNKIPKAYLAALAAKAATSLHAAATPAKSASAGASRVAPAAGAKIAVMAGSRPGRAGDTVTAGTMPDLEGLSMKDAQARLLAARLPFEFTGTGVALEQRPRAFETLEQGTLAKVRFGLERERMRSMAGKAGLSPDRTTVLSDSRKSSAAMATSATLEADMAKTPLLRISGRGRRPMELPAATVTASRVPAAVTVTRAKPVTAAGRGEQAAVAPLPEQDEAVLNGPDPDGGRSAWATVPKPAPAVAPAPAPAPKRTKPAAKVPVARRGIGRAQGDDVSA